MLKLNKSNDTQTLAIHLDSTAPINALVLSYSQSYDLSNGNIEYIIDRIKGQYYIGTISGSQMPAYSGQYDINVFEGEFIEGVWSEVAVDFGAYDEIWSQAGGYAPTGSVLRTMRAWVSGSNESSFKEYESPNQLGTYTTYNG